MPIVAQGIMGAGNKVDNITVTIPCNAPWNCFSCLSVPALYEQTTPASYFSCGIVAPPEQDIILKMASASTLATVQSKKQL